MSESHYRIIYKRSPAKSLRSIDRQHQKRIITAIEALSSNLRPDGVKKLKGGSGEYRIRIGPFRVIYDITDSELIILVLNIGDRKDIYRPIRPTHCTTHGRHESWYVESASGGR